MCPNELTCGDNGNKFIIPKADGSRLVRRIDKHDNLFLDNDVCSWIIKNPPDMGPRDWMWVRVSNVDRANVWISKGFDYRYKERNRPENAAEKKFGMLRGLDYYVIAVAHSKFPAYLRLDVWIEKSDYTPPPEP